jgi:WD40 repeat protein
MTDHDPTGHDPLNLPEEPWEALLADSDNILAQGRTPDLARLPASPDQQRQLQQDLLFLQELRRALSPQSPTVIAGEEGTATQPARHLDTPPVLGRFEIRRELGRGGCGVVYLAYDPLLKRDVAVKVPRPEFLTAPHLRERFRREAQATAGLEHPNLVPVYDIGEVGPICFLVSAYCPGVTLTQWLRERTEPVPPRLAAALLAQVADCVQHAHSRGVIHRDLKPSNILLESVVNERSPGESLSLTTDDGTRTTDFVPRVTDFGLAKLLAASELTTADDTTRTGAVIGTVLYMAPEQAAGKTRELGPAADIYALGAILYELVTGRPPFQGETDQATLAQIQQDEPIAPARLRPGLPRDLETICLKCLRKEPKARYASAAELADDLRRFEADQPIRARRAGWPERTWNWCRRHSSVAAMAALAAVLALVIIGGSLTAAVWLGRERDAAIDAEQEAKAAQRQLERNLYDAYLLQAEASRSSGPGQRLRALEAVAGAAKLLPRLGLGDEEVLRVRNEAIAALSRADLRLDCRWAAYAPGIEHAAIAIDADGQHYAVLEEQYIAIRRLKDNELVTQLTGIGPSEGLPFVRLSPDGRWLAARIHRGGSRFVQIWDIPARKTLLADPIPAGLGLNWQGMDFSPNSRLLALIQADGGIALHELPSGRRTKAYLPGSHPWNVQFHPKAPKLAVDQAGRVFILDLESGKSGPIFPDCNNSAWSLDGEWLACARNNPKSNEARVYNARTGALHTILRGHQLPVVHIAVNSAGSVAATSSWDGTTRLWDLHNGRQLVMDEGIATEFSRDGRWLGAGLFGETAGRWEAFPSREYRCLACGEGETLYMDISPDGRLLVSTFTDGIRLTEVATGVEIARIPEHASVRFHPSGRSILCGGSRLVEHRLEQDESGTMRLGPPQPLAKGPTGRVGSFALDAHGHFVALAAGDQVRTLALQEKGIETESSLVGSHGGLHSIVVSGDGRWAATGTFNGHNVKVWDLSKRALERELPGRTAFCAFSPDSQWLVVGTDGEYRFYATQSWELRHRIPCGGSRRDGPAAFSRDGKVLAVAHGAFRVKLLDAASRQELATLLADDPGVISKLSWHPAGEGVAVGTSQGVMYWDLRLIRAQLASLGLDW